MREILRDQNRKKKKVWKGEIGVRTPADNIA